jgi:hypothetical protein
MAEPDDVWEAKEFIKLKMLDAAREHKLAPSRDSSWELIQSLAAYRFTGVDTVYEVLMSVIKPNLVEISKMALDKGVIMDISATVEVVIGRKHTDADFVEWWDSKGENIEAMLLLMQMVHNWLEEHLPPSEMLLRSNLDQLSTAINRLCEWISNNSSLRRVDPENALWEAIKGLRKGE